MSWTELITLALAQGLTEFLPVSSSGHLVLVHHLWGVEAPTLMVDVLLHVGTTAAVMVAYRRTIREWVLKRQRELGLVVLAMVPTVCLGLALHGVAQLATQRTMWVGLALILTGCWLSVGNWRGRLRAAEKTQQRSISWRQAVMIGVAQGLAVIPGISRSGATVSTALSLGIGPQQAVQFSLLISIPAIIGATLYQYLQSASAVASLGLTGAQCGVALALTFSVGYAMIRLLQYAVARYRLLPFAWYCGIVGCFVLLGGRG